MKLPDISQYARCLPVACTDTPAGHLAMLEAHFRATNRKITASELARAAGYSSYAAANLQYGIFAHKLCNEIGFAPPRGNSGEPTFTYIFATPLKLPNSDWQWTMHDVVAQAIERSNIFGADVAPSNGAPVYSDDVLVGNYVEGATVQIIVNAIERRRGRDKLALSTGEPHVAFASWISILYMVSIRRAVYTYIT